MAKMKMGILGPLSGKIGPVIGGVWKGTAYLKAKPKSDKKRVLSPAQRAHHQKFAFLTRWLRPIHSHLTIGFKNLAEHTTEINAAFAYNFKAALLTNETGHAIDYPNFRISLGELLGLEQVHAELLDQTTLKLTWCCLENKLSAHDDQLMILLYNDDLGIADGGIGGIKRSAESGLLRIDTKLQGKPFHLYVSVMALNGHEIANSQYLGRMEPI